MNGEDIEITPLTLAELRADVTGTQVSQMAALAYRAFREPPWNDDLELPRLQFGLGVDLMRRNARVIIARLRPDDHVVGYLLGYEVLRTNTDHRDLTLADLSGTHRLDNLFEDARPMFYWDTLCVDPAHRQQRLAHGLSRVMTGTLHQQGLRHIARTSVKAVAMRRLFAKLGFEELPVHDAFFPDRTYWLLSS